ncbi:DUF1353 domain-containing protein [Pikeienuella sp. HZG-20]|uniref:DUF1353 domain-containing protein n=1 Tax=Paludibacillus litoralis TaxID=3133267 RepID=UPI0030ED4946
MSEPEERQPVSITRASFQAASNYEGLSSKERRRRRAETRAKGAPPGLIAQKWVTDDAFCYDVGHPGSGERHVVGKGYEFDGASVPFPLTVLVPQTHSLYLAAAALHDWLYEVEHELVEREKADAIFREAMMVLGLNWVWAGLMWRAVRAGGWAVWYSRKPETIEWRLLQAPALLRVPIVWLVTLVRGLYGAFLIDIWSLPKYRAEARRIQALDATEAEGCPLA